MCSSLSKVVLKYNYKSCSHKPPTFWFNLASFQGHPWVIYETDVQRNDIKGTSQEKHPGVSSKTMSCGKTHIPFLTLQGWGALTKTSHQTAAILRPCLAPGTDPGHIQRRHCTLMCFHYATLFFTATLQQRAKPYIDLSHQWLSKLLRGEFLSLVCTYC